jgi:hypothetical protein
MIRLFWSSGAMPEGPLKRLELKVSDPPLKQRHGRPRRVRGPPDLRGYTGRKGAAVYLGVSDWQFGVLLREGIVPRGFTMTWGGKHYWSYRVLDEAMDKAARSRKPRRPVQGIAKQYSERHAR